MRTRAIVVVVAVVIMAVALVYSQRRKAPPQVSGFIEADEIRIGSRVGGRVARVAVEEGQRVKPGDVVLELEPFDLRERASEAEAELQAKRADLARLEAGFRSEEIAQAKAKAEQAAARLLMLKNGPRPQEIAAAEARLKQAHAQLELAATTLDRVKKSFEASAASALEMDQAAEAQKTAAAAVTASTADLDLLKAGTRAEEITQAEAATREADAAAKLAENGYRKEDIDAAKAAVAAAESALAALKQQIEELVVKAPVEGTVEAVELRKGDLVPANAPALSIMDTSHLWVRAYLPENHLDVAVGQKMQVRVDSFPGRTFAGHVSFVARQAEFTPNNVQTPEERSKQVFRVKVDLDEGLDVLRAGMAADVLLGQEKSK